MSLHKQFWLFLVLLLMSAFLGSFIFSCIATRNYLEEQLTQKNNDNALTIALSLSSGDQDDMEMELAITSQFDLGHYRFINLVNSEGKVIANHYDNRDYREAPRWLSALFPIEINPGRASVTRGWQQVGTLTLSSHERFAYQQLWDNARQLLYYFVLIALVFFVCGSIALRWLNAALLQAVTQAKAIGERRFVTSKEPSTPELRELIRSLNKLSRHVKQMLARESAKLEQLRQKTQYDEITGLQNRGPVLKQLNTFLQRNGSVSSGAVYMVRIDDLFSLNQQLGRASVDELLVHLGREISRLCARYAKQSLSGRLNGSDFILVIPAMNERAENATAEIHRQLHGVLLEHKLEAHRLITAGARYTPETRISDLLSQLNEGLQEAVQQPASQYCFVTARASENTPQQDWAKLLNDALTGKNFHTAYQPVTSNDQTPLHWETVFTLHSNDGTMLQEPEYLPQVSRLGLDAALDTAKVDLALHSLSETTRPLAIGISSSTLADTSVQHALVTRLQGAGTLAQWLHIELPEQGLLQRLDNLKHFSESLRELDCKLGIAAAGHEIEHIAQLHNLGVNYVKLDAMFVADIHNSTAHQAFVRGFCTVLHTLGIRAIATGVSEAAEWETLQQLGIDAGAGDFFKPGA